MRANLGAQRRDRTARVAAALAYARAKRRAWAALEQASARTLREDRRAWAAFHAALDAAEGEYRAALQREETDA